jgi:hypothetical protein
MSNSSRRDLCKGGIRWNASWLHQRARKGLDTKRALQMVLELGSREHKHAAAIEKAVDARLGEERRKTRLAA